MWNGTMFADFDWPLNASRGFVSISWASCSCCSSFAFYIWLLSVCVCFVVTASEAQQKREQNETPALREQFPVSFYAGPFFVFVLFMSAQEFHVWVLSPSRFLPSPPSFLPFSFRLLFSLPSAPILFHPFSYPFRRCLPHPEARWRRRFIYYTVCIAR